MTKLVCPECRHENESERIYCHHCGARLDRSGLKKKTESTDTRDTTQEHLRKMFDPNRGRTSALVTKFVKVLLGAFVLALVVQMVLPPDLPAGPPQSDAIAPMINMDMLAALENHNPPRLTYSQEQVNDYLAGIIRRKDSPAKEGLLPIKRLFAQFDEGACRMNVTYTFFGLPISVSGIYGVAAGANNLTAACKGGYIGRMPIYPALMNQLGFLFHKAWLALGREQKQLARMSGIELHQGSISLLTTPQG